MTFVENESLQYSKNYRFSYRTQQFTYANVFFFLFSLHEMVLYLPFHFIHLSNEHFRLSGILDKFVSFTKQLERVKKMFIPCNKYAAVRDI